MNAVSTKQRSELFEFDLFIRLFCNEEDVPSRTRRPVFQAPLEVSPTKRKDLLRAQAFLPALPYPQYLDFGRC